jgi:hypothetical protein
MSPTPMLLDLQVGQTILLNNRKFRILTVVHEELVCLEIVESGSLPAGVWIMEYDQVRQKAQLVKP